MGHHLAHEFGHAAVRGAGYAAGRHLEHALYGSLGIWGLALLVLVALAWGRRR